MIIVLIVCMVCFVFSMVETSNKMNGEEFLNREE